MTQRRSLTPEETLEAGRLRTAWTLYKAIHPGATQTWFAAESGLGTQGVVSQYMRGIIPLNLPALLALCKVIGADPKKISPRLTAALEGVVQMDQNEDAPQLGKVLSAEEAEADDRLVRVRTLKLSLRAGINGVPLEECTEDGPPIFMPSEVIRAEGLDPRFLVATRVKGASMERTLFDGDVAVTNLADTKPADNKIFSFNYEGEAVIKRLVRDNGEWWMVSDNPDQSRYPRKICRGTLCLIIGRVVFRQSSVL